MKKALLSKIGLMSAKATVWWLGLVTGGLIAGCSRPFDYDRGSPADLLTRSQVREYREKARAGDAQCAYDLHYHYFLLQDDRDSSHWLRVAAMLGHPRAVLWEVLKIEYGQEGEYEDFGPTRQAAVLNLLTPLATQNLAIAAKLGVLYERGYFGSPDATNAIRYLRLAADMGDIRYWSNLGTLLAKSSATGAVEEAYYWVSMKTRVTHPASGTGEEMWALREDLTSKLSLPVLEGLWRRIDEDTEAIRSGRRWTNYRPFCYFNNGRDDELYREGVEITDKMELEYRTKVRRELIGSELGP